ncbi:hypothetical protein [Lichenicola sp.]|uniref:hypothetical protein n=1 Tax=Lichenicola sp. TaxID=2804529 RepID=UPI003AFFDB75
MSRPLNASPPGCDRDRAGRPQLKPSSDPIDPSLLEMVRARSRSRRTLIQRRLEVGYQWHGGPVGRNDRYQRPPFVCLGLPSSDHPILQCFVSKLRRVQGLRIGDDKSQSYASDSKLLALDAPYVEDNSIVCGVLRIELDRVLTWAGVVAGCRTAGVPLPNIVVGHEDATGHVWHPHLLWLLHDSMPLQGARNRRFLGKYHRGLRGLTGALLDLGADPGGLMNSHRHKNAVSPLWSRRVLAEQPYDLDELARHVDTSVTMAELGQRALAIRGRSAARVVADHPDPEVSAGSNVGFRQLAMWARNDVVVARALGLSEEAFGLRVAAEACRTAYSRTGDSRRVETVLLLRAARVTRWTWRTYKVPVSRPKFSATAARLRIDEGRRHAAAGRSARTEATIIAAALRLAVDGQRPTQTAVLDAVVPTIRGERTVRRYWHAVEAALKAREDLISRAATPGTAISPSAAPNTARKVAGTRQVKQNLAAISYRFPGPSAGAHTQPIPAFLLRQIGRRPNIEAPP